MRTVFISNSMLRSMHTCSTQAWLRTRGLSALAEDNKKMRAGRDAHLAFATWLGGALDVDACVQPFEDAYSSYSDQFLLEKDAYHVSNLVRVLQVFFASNPLAAMPFEVVEIERQGIELELFRTTSTRYVVTDKPDAMVRMKDTGALMPFEAKTVGYFGENYLDDYALDSQVTTHVAAALARGHLDVAGVLLQVVQFNKLPDPLAVTPKTGKPASCRTHPGSKVKDCWQQHVRWERFLVARTADDLSTWRDNTVQSILDYEQLAMLAAARLAEVPQEGLYGKCGSCEFLGFCRSQRTAWHLLRQREREAGVQYSGIEEVANVETIS